MTGIPEEPVTGARPLPAGDGAGGTGPRSNSYRGRCRSKPTISW